jgi:NTE family protein
VAWSAENSSDGENTPMNMKRKNRPIGIALGGGAARGFAHVGVLSVLEEEGLAPDFISGTSIGAVVGALTAMGKSADEIMEIMLRFRPPTSAFLFTPVRPQLVERVFHQVLGDATFSDLEIPFCCTATELVEGKTIILTEGKLADALTLSSRVPLVFPPVRRDHEVFVDGGVLCNLPVTAVKDLGAERVLAVHLGFIGIARYARSQRGVQLAIRCVDLLGKRLMALEAEKADLVLHPKVEDMFALDFKKARRFYERGREAGLAARKQMVDLWKN